MWQRIVHLAEPCLGFVWPSLELEDGLSIQFMDALAGLVMITPSAGFIDIPTAFFWIFWCDYWPTGIAHQMHEICCSATLSWQWRYIRHSLCTGDSRGSIYRPICSRRDCGLWWLHGNRWGRIFWWKHQATWHSTSRSSDRIDLVVRGLTHRHCSNWLYTWTRSTGDKQVSCQRFVFTTTNRQQRHNCWYWCYWNGKVVWSPNWRWLSPLQEWSCESWVNSIVRN